MHPMMVMPPVAAKFLSQNGYLSPHFLNLVQAQQLTLEEVSLIFYKLAPILEQDSEIIPQALFQKKHQQAQEQGRNFVQAMFQEWQDNPKLGHVFFPTTAELTSAIYGHHDKEKISTILYEWYVLCSAIWHLRNRFKSQLHQHPEIQDWLDQELKSS